jgi:WD40 repeat protein
MTRRIRLFGLAGLIVGLALTGTAISLPSARAQGTLPAGVLAFVGVDRQGSASPYLMDLASGRVGQVDIPVSPDASLAWQPSGMMLAFTTQDGTYGLLRSLRGCFDTPALCSDMIEVVPAFTVEEVAWTPGGEALVFLTDSGLKISPPRARPSEIRDLSLPCGRGIDTSSSPFYLFCAADDSTGNVHAAVYQPGAPDFTLAYEIGTFPALTAYDIGPDARSAVGTLETAGDSGFYTPPSGMPSRLVPYQIHVYDLEFAPDGNRIAIAGAISDSTGDGTLRDGDLAELFIYETATGALSQIPGFTGASEVTWSPDGSQILVVGGQNLTLYTPQTGMTLPVSLVLPQPDLEIHTPAWSPSAPGILPAVPTATPRLPGGPTAVPTPTFALIFTPLSTLTPLPTFTPFPTYTPIPSVTPGSPMGAGCQYAYVGGGLPVAVGDTAEVTTYGAAVRFRTGAALDAPMIRELAPGTRMTIISGPTCSQGYRWWQAQLQTSAQVGYLADSDPGGNWIKAVVPAPPAETISFYADRYAIHAGECVVLTWAVEGIKEVYYQGVGVTGHESRAECPAATATYTLRIIRADDSVVTQQITITVSSGP